MIVGESSPPNSAGFRVAFTFSGVRSVACLLGHQESGTSGSRKTTTKQKRWWMCQHPQQRLVVGVQVLSLNNIKWDRRLR